MWRLVCVRLLMAVMFAVNTVCVVSFRVECVSVACLTLSSPITVVVMTSDCVAGGFTYATLEAAKLKWRYRCAESGLSLTACPGWEDGWSPILGRSSVRVWPGTIRGICLCDCFTVWFYMLWISLCVSLSLCENTVHMFVRWSDKDEENPFECKGQSNQMCIWVLRALVIKGMK